MAVASNTVSGLVTRSTTAWRKKHCVMRQHGVCVQGYKSSGTMPSLLVEKLVVMKKRFNCGDSPSEQSLGLKKTIVG